MTRRTRLFFGGLLLATVCTSVYAQDSRAILNTAAQALGGDNLKTLQYSAAGSIFDDKGQQIFVSSFSRQLDLNASTSNTRMVLVQGTQPMPRTVTQTSSPTSPWETQFDFWLTPYGFLKGAMSSDATAETKSVDGGIYKVVTFMLSGNHKIVGYINDRNLVERVEARTENDVLIQAFYHDYETFGELKVPTVMIQRRGGNLSQVLILKEVKPNA